MPATHAPARPAETPRPPLARLALLGLAGGVAAGLVLALAAGQPVEAQAIAGFDASQPVHYAADRIELQDRASRVILSGNVVISQGDLTLTAARTTVAFTQAGTLQINRIDAAGGVVVTRGNERASGASGTYDFDRRVIVLSGGVALRRGSDTLEGGRLIIDLQSGLSSVDGASPTAAAPRGRVTGTFTVPQRN